MNQLEPNLAGLIDLRTRRGAFLAHAVVCKAAHIRAVGSEAGEPRLAFAILPTGRPAVSIVEDGAKAGHGEYQNIRCPVFAEETLQLYGKHTARQNQGACAVGGASGSIYTLGVRRPASEVMLAQI